jgi:hypothetical protein
MLAVFRNGDGTGDRRRLNVMRANMIFVTAKTRKASPRRHGKVTLQKATASEILAAVKVTPAEKRRAQSAVASVKRGTSGVSGSVKRLSSPKRVTASKIAIETK